MFFQKNNLAVQVTQPIQRYDLKNLNIVIIGAMQKWAKYWINRNDNLNGRKIIMEKE